MAAMTVLAYIMAIFSEPGSVPSFYIPNIEGDEIPLKEVKKTSGDLRFCQKCNHYKPPRTHHCHVCNRCVLRMDHHCIWINNCVGHSNYKIFFLLSVYGATTCIYSMVLLGCAIYHVYKNQQQTGELFKTSHVVCAALLCPLTFGLIFLLIWHIYLIVNNMTTIENFDGVKSIYGVDRERSNNHHPYDLGAYENFRSVLGRNVICWLCPTEANNGSGLYFRTTIRDANTASSSNV
ncbi:hypothetical protein J5N97_009887 [Dioscorea zingiberensis]|uniref:S-acyltransferase n=1 Tax=Dioscorea zingiberensis TaxID=325984 RepID=A0A9D5HN44_9LILI|nr:hypothetical protein J5N97_009887 [Dioscorea zingiberensis]